MTSALRWWWVVNATPRPLYPLYRRLGRPRGRSGRVRKISPPTGIRSPDLPACNESLYRLNYNNNGYFTQILVRTYMIISRLFLLRTRNSSKGVQKIKNKILHSKMSFPPENLAICKVMCKNMAESDRPQMTI